MSLFKRPQAAPSPAPAPAWTPPAKSGHAGSRHLAYRMDEPVPHHRKDGIKPSAKVEHIPDGCLFKVAGGFFDLQGYWCVRKADGLVVVTRGASKKVMRLLTEPQRKELHRVRLNARRHGLR